MRKFSARALWCFIIAVSFPLGLEIRGGAQGPAALMWLAVSLALSGRPALPGRPGPCGEDMFGEMRGLRRAARQRSHPNHCKRSGKIPGILGIFSMLIDILGIPGIFNIPV